MGHRLCAAGARVHRVPPAMHWLPSVPQRMPAPQERPHGARLPLRAASTPAQLPAAAHSSPLAKQEQRAAGSSRAQEAHARPAARPPATARLSNFAGRALCPLNPPFPPFPPAAPSCSCSISRDTLRGIVSESTRPTRKDSQLREEGAGGRMERDSGDWQEAAGRGGSGRRRSGGSSRAWAA